MRTRLARHLFAAGLVAAAPFAAGAQRTGVASLVAADRALATRASAGIAALAAESAADVVFLYPGAPVLQGHDAVRRLLDSVAAATHDRLAWSPARVELSSDGARGYTYGRGTRTTTGVGRDDVRGMRYVAWWRRDDAGTWRPSAWLLIDERGESDRTGSSAAWPCRTPATAADTASISSPSATTQAIATKVIAAKAIAAQVIATDSAFAQRAAAVGAAVAFAEYVADDGISIGAAGAPACGKSAVGAQLTGAAPSDFVWSPIAGDASGDLGYTVGTASIRGERGVHHSKYLTIWKRQLDGTWRFVVDGGNAAPARVATFTAHR